MARRRTLAGAVRLLPLLGLWACASPPEAPLPGFESVVSMSHHRRLENGALDSRPDAVEQLDGRAVILQVGDDADKDREAAAALAARGGQVYYWIEVSRCPALADAHPEWMASLQTHPEWRRRFKGFPELKEGEVAKCYPWVPILYEESFAAHRDRIRSMLSRLPAPAGIFLNGLQAAPSACGCGNDLCRWVADYGPVKTATPLGDDAAARFVRAVKALAPGVPVVPVWVPECEEHDTAPDGACAGVPCFTGACWKEWTAQLGHVARESETIAVLLTYKALRRDLPAYAQPAGWVKAGLESFQTMPPQRGGEAVPAKRLIAVIQGWDVSEEERGAQLDRAIEAGAAAVVGAGAPIDQSWEPRVHRVGTAAAAR
jgi:hypothetical protein